MDELALVTQRLMTEEGFRPLPYKDTRGLWTVGYGHNLTVPMSKSAAAALLGADIAPVQGELNGYDWYRACDPVRRSVLLDMAFNMGTNGLLGFPHMLDAVKHKDYGRAADEMASSLWFHQVGQRAQHLADLMRNGQ